MHDFDAFLRECYDRVEGHAAPWLDMRARFRIWSRCTDAFRDELAAHLRDRGHAFDAEAQAYGGLRMKPLPAAPYVDDIAWLQQRLPQRFPSTTLDLSQALFECPTSDRRAASFDIARSAAAAPRRHAVRYSMEERPTFHRR
jgi:hypothetical protein